MSTKKLIIASHFEQIRTNPSQPPFIKGRRRRRLPPLEKGDRGGFKVRNGRWLQKPNFKEELKFYKKGYKYVAGIDEVGRGPLAGKITAAAVIFPASEFQVSSFKFQEVNDSKKMTSAKREELYKVLTTDKKIKWAVASVSEKIIDKIGIHNATQLAMLRAVKKLETQSKIQPDFIIFDGKPFRSVCRRLDLLHTEFVVKGDEKVMSCAAASIIAKVTRDRAMMRLHKKYPEYCFDKHKGYGTKLHLEMIRKYGPCKIHRKSFKPIRD